jgi:hypothetical protein
VNAPTASASRRRFLVVVRAGDTSLHPTWVDVARPRSFDLVVSYYGRDPQKYRDGAFPRIDDPGQKFIGAQRLLQRDPFWRAYDYVWLPDDDLATDQDEIDELFARADAMGLALGHPALDWHSHYWHVVMVRSPSFSARYVDFIELMGPVFSRAFLERCLPTFDENLSGWGLSFLWPHMLGSGLRRCAIIDDATVTHTRPFGGPTYDLLRKLGRDPRDEARDLYVKYGLPPDPMTNVLGAIDANGRALDLANRADQGRYGRTRQRDIEAFAKARPRIEIAALGRRPPPTWRTMLPLATLRASVSRLRFPS